AHGSPEVAKGGRYLSRRNGLGNECVHAGLQAPLLVEVGRVGGGRDDDGAPRRGLDGAVAGRHLGADHSGKVPIQKGDVVMGALEAGEGLDAVVHDVGLDVELPEDRLHGYDVVVDVLDD